VPPRVGSRYGFSLGVRDDVGLLQLTDREPYRFRAHADNRVHMAVQGDTFWDLAGRYFAPLPRACGYWWAVADFQPDPVVDPTLVLEPGRRVFIPSLRVLTDVILGEAGRKERA
jgi:hypothetical protein